jgi:hypothetical protein
LPGRHGFGIGFHAVSAQDQFGLIADDFRGSNCLPNHAGAGERTEYRVATSAGLQRDTSQIPVDEANDHRKTC